jgi:hypothetical protein
MPNRRAGTIAVVDLKDGTKAFHLRFRIRGRRVREIVHERPGCYCGCGGDWTLPQACAELDRIIRRVDARDAWKPSSPSAAMAQRARALGGHAIGSAERWKAGEFGRPRARRQRRAPG